MALHGRLAVRACIALAVLLATAQVTWAGPSNQAATPVGEPAGANWAAYGGNLFNQRYSSLD
jgi:glucose dehydrogenase